MRCPRRCGISAKGTPKASSSPSSSSSWRAAGATWGAGRGGLGRLLGEQYLPEERNAQQTSAQVGGSPGPRGPGGRLSLVLLRGNDMDVIGSALRSLDTAEATYA